MENSSLFVSIFFCSIVSSENDLKIEVDKITHMIEHFKNELGELVIIHEMFD